MEGFHFQADLQIFYDYPPQSNIIPLLMLENVYSLQNSFLFQNNEKKAIAVVKYGYLREKAILILEKKNFFNIYLVREFFAIKSN